MLRGAHGEYQRQHDGERQLAADVQQEGRVRQVRDEERRRPRRKRIRRPSEDERGEIEARHPCGPYGRGTGARQKDIEPDERDQRDPEIALPNVAHHQENGQDLRHHHDVQARYGEHVDRPGEGEGLARLPRQTRPLPEQDRPHEGQRLRVRPDADAQTARKIAADAAQPGLEGTLRGGCRPPCAGVGAGDAVGRPSIPAGRLRIQPAGAVPFFAGPRRFAPRPA